MIPEPNFQDKETITLSLNRITNDSDGQYTDNGILSWFYSFVKMCQEKLNLTIQKGPGTSLGVIQDKVGFIQYQFDVDWNNKVLYPQCPQPLSPWKNATDWDKDNDLFVSQYGIDFNNYRFDTIIWFNRKNEVNPIGIRFKYPVITGRDVMTPFWYITMPVVMPWQDESFEGKETKIVDLSIFKDMAPEDGRDIVDWDRYWTSRLSYYDTSSKILGALNYRNMGCLMENYGETGYYSLGNQYYVFEGGKLTFSEDFYSEDRSWKDFQNYNSNGIMPSNDIQLDTNLGRDTVVLRVLNTIGGKGNFLSLIYGNFEKNEDELIDSYVIVNTLNTLNTKDLFSDFVASNNIVWSTPSKVVNRPVSTNNITTDTRISRVVLPNFYNNDSTFMPTSSLFQVFSFGTLMTKEERYEKIFLDNNNKGRQFKLINFGNKTTQISEQSYANTALIALEKGEY